MRGTFGGWFEIHDQPSRAPLWIAALLLGAAVLSWLATVLLWIAVAAGVLVLAVVPAVVVMRRWAHAEPGRFQPDPPRPVTVTAPQAMTVNHFHGGTHYHGGELASPPHVIQGIPLPREAISDREGR